MYRPQYGAANDNHDIVNGSVRNYLSVLYLPNLMKWWKWKIIFQWKQVILVLLLLLVCLNTAFDNRQYEAGRSF